MQLSKFAALALAAAIAAGSATAFAADEVGKCGKGKIYNPDVQKCVAKPKGSWSGSHSG
jgi:hypothetical protein